jgi:excinuclease ABC subunit A
VTLAGYNIHELSRMSLWQLAEVLQGISGSQLRGASTPLVPASLAAARRRLDFLIKVGLGYLHLNQPASALSAGEAQRIRLAALLGGGLTSLTVLLDEPTRGMHPCEVEALRDALWELRDAGNSLIVVEHDLVLIRAADHLVDMGPGAGLAGGEIVAQGTPAVVAQAGTLTGLWLQGARRPQYPAERRKPSSPEGGVGSWLVVRGARANNLQGGEVRLPLGVLAGVCGVSGSGKSTLLVDTLGRALVRAEHTTSFAQAPSEPGEHDAVEGAPARCVLVDQARQGIRSPAAFLGLAEPLLALYAASPDAHALGLGAAELGRPCSACKGAGVQRLEMGFLPDLAVECETCRGTGCLPEAWEVRVQGCALPEVNALTFDEAAALFAGEERIARPLEAARRVGLGYLVWRQPAFTLSGGEAQRLKIARELCRTAGSRASRGMPAGTLYLLDEPTVGQHMDDVARLIGVLRGLVDAGHTAIVIEHHPLLLAACDWLVELGPGGGPQGGRVIAEGPPAQVAAGQTPTAPYLRQALEAAR